MAVSTPEDASGRGGASGSDRVRLLADTAACLSAWQGIVATQGIRPADPAFVELRRQSGVLATALPGVGFGGIAVHLRELVRKCETGAFGEARQSLDVLAHLSEQAWLSLSPYEQALFTQHASAAPQQGSPSAPAPPPFITIGPGRDRREQSGIVPMPGPAGPQSVQPPRLIDSGIIRGSSDKPPALPPFVQPGQGLPGPGGSPGVAAPPLVGPAPPKADVAPPPAVLPPAAGPLEVANPPAGRPANKPNLLVRSMLGLRAIGRGRPSAGPSPLPSPGDSSEHKGLLGLRRSTNVSSPGIPSPDVAKPPPLLNRSPSGLPPLPASPTPVPPPAAGSPRRSGAIEASPSGARDVRELLSGLERRRAREARPRLRGTLFRRAEDDGGGYRAGAIAAAVLALVLGGLTTLVVVLTRQDDETERPRPVPSASAGPAASATDVGDDGLPRQKLLNENESFRALLAQVHGRGKESPQLRALVDEQAALAARAMSPQKCEGTPAACEEWAKIREAVLGNENVKRITRRRSAGSPDRIRSRWLVGLKLPEIPVEDDPRVQRQFEFYTENPVGRETFQAMLFRCGAYRDLIQSTLIRYGLPADLLAVVFAESSCEPRAKSPVGAVGLWQFMPATARAYHLRVKEGVVDERMSPPKSTEAAVRYLRDLHDKLVAYDKRGVWDLVFSAYNMGPFAMVARIERAGGDVGFWDLVDADLLPDETSNYTPAVQAIALILNNLQRLKFSGTQMRAPQLTSDLEVPPGTRLGLIARAASMSVNQLRALNLDISGDVTPDVPNFAVQVPKDVVWQARDTLKELLARRDAADLCVSADFDWGRQRFTKEMAAACKRKLEATP